VIPKKQFDEFIITGAQLVNTRHGIFLPQCNITQR